MSQLELQELVGTKVVLASVSCSSTQCYASLLVRSADLGNSHSFFQHILQHTLRTFRIEMMIMKRLFRISNFVRVPKPFFSNLAAPRGIPSHIYHHMTFFYGDLNYRIQHTRPEVMELIKAKDFKTLQGKRTSRTLPDLTLFRV